MLNMKMVLVMVIADGMLTDVGVTDGAHTITIVVMISMISVLPVQDHVEDVPVLAGVMKPVPITGIAVLMLVICAQLKIHVMDHVEVVLDHVGVMNSVLDMEIVVLITKIHVSVWPVLETVEVMLMVVGVMLGAHIMETVAPISMILVLLVMVCVVVTPVLAGVIPLVLIMGIAVQIMVACVLTITENKLIEKLLKKPTKLLELTE